MRRRDREVHWDGPDLGAWEPWSPRRVAELLLDAPPSWCIVGGWAIDLWLGRETRPHGDIEVAIPRCDFGSFRTRFEPHYRLHAVGDSETCALDPHEPVPATKHQCWIAEPAAERWRLDLMLEPGDRRTWIFRRDESIRESRAGMILRSGDIAFLRPEAVLLYKAKACRDKDQVDFETCLPHLSGDARAWLAGALSIVHPGHPWIGRCRRG